MNIEITTMQIVHCIKVTLKNHFTPARGFRKKIIQVGLNHVFYAGNKILFPEKKICILF